jgi:DNA-binding MarR family transcriptional regulator
VAADRVDGIQQAWQRERPDVDSHSIAIVTRIWRLARHLERARTEVLAALGTDAPTLDALATLRRAGAPYRLTAGEMQQRSLVTAGAISQRLDKLEQAGFLRRERDTRDRRIVHVALTDRGQRLVDRVFTALMEREQALLATLSREDRTTLTAILRRWLVTFEGSNSVGPVLTASPPSAPVRRT